jgi:hypothetical protein
LRLNLLVKLVSQRGVFPVGSNWQAKIGRGAACLQALESSSPLCSSMDYTKIAGRIFEEMEKWEYCSIALGWSGSLVSKSMRKYIAYITYYTPDGKRHLEELPTDLETTSDNIGIAIDAMGYALARLGQNGWELVSVQHETRSDGFGRECEAVLKRRIVTTSP